MNARLRSCVAGTVPASEEAHGDPHLKPVMPKHAESAPPAEGHRLLALHFPADTVPVKTRAIHQAMCRDSPRVRDGNFTFIAPPDLALLFDLYDSHFFEGRLRALLRAGGTPLFFKLSHRMTRTAATTTRYERRGRRTVVTAPALHYEIVVSTPLLFQTFGDVDRTVRVNGVVCHDRLEALQRILEHEIVHLLEMLTFGSSSCTSAQFQTLAWNLFAHTETRHDLVTQRERALARFDMRVGDQVSFELDGTRHVGVINRITKRATILVESERGTPYGDGKKYLKFYVPLSMLKKIPKPGTSPDHSNGTGT